MGDYKITLRDRIQGLLGLMQDLEVENLEVEDEEENLYSMIVDAKAIIEIAEARLIGIYHEK